MTRLRRNTEDVFAQDHGDHRRGGRFRWFVSTCFAAGIGGFAILFALLGANDDGNPSRLILQSATAVSETTNLPAASLSQGLAWAIPKGDKLIITSGALSSKFIIHDQVRQVRDNRSYLQKKTYARIVGHLASAPPVTEADRIPPFNPYTLYATTGAGADNDALADVEQQEAKLSTVELLGGILPNDDGQDMAFSEVVDVVARDAAAEAQQVTLKPGFEPSGAEKLSGQQLLAQRAQRGPDPLPPNTTALAKTVGEIDDGGEDLESQVVRTVKVGRGDSLAKILERLETDSSLIGEIVFEARNILPDQALLPGLEVQVTLTPSVTKAQVNDVVRLSVYGEGHEHKLTIVRNADGFFKGSATPLDDPGRRTAGTAAPATTANLYSALFLAVTSQGVAPETIMQILKVHASETDFRRRAGATDALELFFDVKEEDRGTDGALGELLATALTVGGETQKYYRFRMPNGSIDFYDEYGNNSRKFLMRKPVRGEVRFADGFGYRRHPLLHILRRHAGIDWAGSVGTPIMAAGAGVVEEAGFHGEFGNYVRVRHANGYSTAYAHMRNFAAGMAKGARVVQGQVIGYMGTSGLSTGPHLHFEILVNNQQVDPMKMPVPKERKLEGRDLADFQKERARIDELMRRNPVSTKIIEAQTGK